MAVTIHGLVPVSTVFGPFHRDPGDALAREMRAAIEAGTWCDIHGIEPGPHHQVCLECGHGWPTPEALVADHNALVARRNAADVDPLGGWYEPIPEENDAERVTVCPLCAHDL